MNRSHALAAIAWIAFTVPLLAEESPRPASAKKLPARPASESVASESTTAAEPIERQPYRIIFHLACHPSSRIDSARRAELLREWQVMARRFVGRPWSVTIAPPSGRVLDLDLEGLEKATPAQASAFEKAVDAGSYDKVWVVHADRPRGESGLVFTGREYDTATRRLGPFQRRSVEVLADAPRALLSFTLDLFSPTALIEGKDAGKVLLKVRGSAIEPASPIGRVVGEGTIFQPLRLISTKTGKIVVKIIPWSYLRVESVDGALCRCSSISGLNDPLSQSYIQPNTLAAVGIKPGNVPLRLRFVTFKEKLPGAGFTLIGRMVPGTATRELGMTDRSGRIVLPAGFADGLVVVRLLAGNLEPVREFPVMPGESAEERTIPFDPHNQCVAVEAEVDSIRDEVVDLIALRARLEARMKARLEGEDWNGLEETIREFDRLTPRDQYAKRLAELKEKAAHDQAETRAPILTRTAQMQFNEVQAMIDRYLDDETARAYRKALQDGRAEKDAKAKAQVAAAAARAEALRKAALREATEKAAADRKAAGKTQGNPSTPAPPATPAPPRSPAPTAPAPAPPKSDEPVVPF